MSDISCNPKREFLVDAKKELQFASKSLNKKDDVDCLYAKQHIDMAMKLISGVINCLETPQQTYHLD